ncbi:UvrD-helicase domain-containing protein [Streptosporangium lutulentum]
MRRLQRQRPPRADGENAIERGRPHEPLLRAAHRRQPLAPPPRPDGRLNRQRRPDPRRQTSKQQANILGLSGSAWINGDVKLSAAQQASLAMASIDAWCKTADLELGPEHIKAPANINDPQDIARLQELILPITEKARADIRSKDGKLIWTHDYYLKIAQIVVARANLTLPYRLIMVDECQDTNGAAESLYLGTQSSTQRIIVGDSAQAINGWNGSIDILNTFPADKVLTLTKSFRFGPAIAEEANKWLQLLDAPIRLQGHPRSAPPSAPSTAPTWSSPAPTPPPWPRCSPSSRPAAPPLWSAAGKRSRAWPKPPSCSRPVSSPTTRTCAPSLTGPTCRNTWTPTHAATTCGRSWNWSTTTTPKR